MEIVANYKQALRTKKELDTKLKSYKLEIRVDEHNKRLRDLKEKLYEYMSQNNLPELEGIKIDKVLPPEERKNLLLSKRVEKIMPVLNQQFDTIEHLAEEIASKM